MTKIYELKPCDSHASFYKKAMVYEEADGSVWLKSYQTFVCRITKQGKFERLYNGYTATTMRHINAFCARYNITGGGKAWYSALPVVDEGAKPFSQTLFGMIIAYKKEEERKARFLASMDNITTEAHRKIDEIFRGLSTTQSA